MMVFLEVAIGILGLSLLAVPVVMAFADRRKMTRPE